MLRSEGEKQAAINKAQGEATAIRVIAEATAAGVRAVAEAIGSAGPGGGEPEGGAAVRRGLRQSRQNQQYLIIPASAATSPASSRPR